MIPGSGRSPRGGNGNTLQYSCLDNPMDRGAWWAPVHGIAKNQTRLSTHTHNLFSAQAHLITSTMRKIFCLFCFTVPEKPLLNFTHLNSIFLLSNAPFKHCGIPRILHPVSDIQHCLHFPKHPDTFYSDLGLLNNSLVLNYGSGGLNSLGNSGCHPRHMESDLGSVRNCP